MPQGNDNHSDSTQHDFIDQLVEEMRRGRQVSATYRLVLNTDKWILPPLASILNLQDNDLNKTAIETLTFLEQKSQNRVFKEWEDFKWRVTAFLEIQDVFDTPIYSVESSVLNLFHLWYFYFESRNLLVESILCGLHGLYAASNSVLRLLLEFSALQLYYRNVCSAQRSFLPLEDYFKSKINPTWSRALRRVLPEDAFCRPIRARLELHHKGLSSAATHPYHPDFSPRHHSTSPARPSLEGIYFWHLANLVLQPILWAYYANFPMLFEPIDILKKFGFGGPVGMFADKQCATAVERSLTKEEYAEFQRYAAGQEDVRSRISWYESLPDLSDEEIAATWDVENYGEIEHGFRHAYGKQMSYIRALREIMALKPPRADAGLDNANRLMDLLSYEKWKTVYKGYSK